MNKRTFIKSTSLLGIGSLISFSSLGKIMDAVAHVPPAELAQDEEFWAAVRRGYTVTSEYINLENGYYCIQPKEILERYIEHIKDVNLQGAHYMRTVQEANKKAAAKKLAELAGCSAEELIITRNTTESLDLIINGIDWKPGDEAVMAEQDYGAMLDMFKQNAKR
ncbi:MAG: Isopenicillin-N epimerase, partial [Flavipsychrobacter sp.]|nr:Isopenicillin-N epimerase [Flavipsychrobacter sp.]